MVKVTEHSSFLKVDFLKETNNRSFITRICVTAGLITNIYLHLLNSFCNQLFTPGYTNVPATLFL
ncbi:MAG: hypothetical protein A3D31_13760 [Candidatus Fluviicola riflensis]|nr:MAG: hypothetical protein CHH17_18195 [Candidatus Fluviicola riflensis]OGS78043.1 MAG: hypothetical protein A3D31_13760 [Candidatus Fluviicola riflensis]OGS85108.1 MAG: hypothetical protein A2724_10695 [Fluviicola sp. RIFCSPHIGHO2_01_FULL_43_53]OGS89380.1 MAG: hypothetical protein A3E30_05000 [Fluviicola sp. RIFCSPHIGHO2_12_FULL_43_24]